VQLRKDKKEDSIQKRRRDVGGSGGGTSASDASLSARRNTEQVGALPDPALKIKLDSLPEDTQLLRSNDPAEQLEATTRFRKLLSIERNPPIAEVIAAGAVPRLVQYCQCYDNAPLLLEATWTLTNISSGTSEHTRVVIDNGAVPIFIHLVRCPHADVREQAVWALGNIAGDSTRCRDLVLSYDVSLGLLPNLFAAMGELDTSSPSQLTMLRNATWTLSNLVRGKPPPRWELIAPVLPRIVQLIHHEDEEVLVDACWALSYICEPAERIAFLIASGALPRLVELLRHSCPNVQTPALRCVGNVATGSEEQAQAVLACDALSAITRLLESGKKDIKKEACWIISNLTAGSSAQIDAVCASGLLPSLLHLVRHEEFDIKKEGAHALCNACVGGSAQTISGLVYLGVLPALCSLLDAPDAELLLAVCEALEATLAAGEANSTAGVNRCVELIDEAGGIDKLEALQLHENAEVYTKAVGLLDSYFGSEESEADAAIAPTAHADGFAFGMPGVS